MTTRSTLEVFPNTFFTKLLRDKSARTDEQGNIFIDRNPHYFGEVLDFLRAGDVWHCMKSAINTEAEFYGLPRPSPLNWQLPKECSSAPRSDRDFQALVLEHEQECAKDIANAERADCLALLELPEVKPIVSAIFSRLNWMTKRENKACFYHVLFADFEYKPGDHLVTIHKESCYSILSLADPAYHKYTPSYNKGIVKALKTIHNLTVSLGSINITRTSGTKWTVGGTSGYRAVEFVWGLPLGKLIK